MTRWTDAPIVGGSYSDDTRPFSVQDTVNYMVVYAEKDGTRSPKMLRGVPGFSEVADTGSAAPIRGMSNVEGLLLVVAGRTLYRVDTKYDCHAIGTIPGVGRVSMAHNQVTGGNQVAIANGLGGYVYDTRDGTLVQITDEGFPGAVSFNYLDSYILGLEPGRRFAFTSELADALSYNTLDQYEAESSPDALVGHAVNHREWWLMGERTIEIFANTGAETGTFQRTTGSGIEVGLASAFAKANLDNSLFWLGSDGVVYRANGYTPQRISTFPIEQAISRCNTKTAFAFTFEDKGHKVFYLTFQDGHTWGYDVASQEWHRRQSKGLDRWRINDLVKWNGRWIAGDYTNGKLYALDWDVQDEAGQTLEKIRVTGVLSDQQNAVIVNAIALVIDTGQPQKNVNPIVQKTYEQTIIDDDPYLLYPLNDPSNVAIELIQGFDGSYSGETYERQMASLLPNGEGGCAYFDSIDAVVSTPSSDILANLVYPFTIEGWIRVTQPVSNLQEYFIFRGTNLSVGVDVDFFGRGHLRRWQSSSGFDLTTDDHAADPGAVYYIAATSAENEMKFYINGALVKTTAYGIGDATRSAEPSLIGALVTGLEEGNRRAIQNVAIYRKVLSHSQISNHWRAAQP